MKLTLYILLALAIFSALSFAEDSLVEKFNSSMVYESRGDYAQAIQELESVYSQSKNDYLVNLRLGWLYYSTGKNEKSKTYYERAINLNSKSVEARLGLTLPLSKLSEWEEIEQTYLMILSLDPFNYTSNLRLGQIYSSRGDYSTAGKYLNTVQELYPGDYETNLSTGWNYFSLGESKKSAQAFQQVLMISPLDTSATRGMNLLK